MAELADALVLGSSVHDVQVQVLLAAPSAKTDNRPEFQQMIKEMTEVYPLRGGCTSVIFIFRLSLPVPHRTRRR